MTASSARTVHRLLASVGLTALVCTLHTSAWAGDAAAAAEVLFGDGKKLVAEGNYAAACPKFEESQKLDPGMGTLYRLADCYEHVGRTASAWAAFLEVASSAKSAGQQARADDAKKRADDLQPQLSKLVVRVTEPAPADLEVKRGTVVVGKAQWNTAIPVDPGEVQVEASAPGRVTWKGTTHVPVRGEGNIVVPRLVEEAVRTKELPPPDGGSSLGTQRTVALGLGAAGVIALGIGTVFGVKSMSKGSDADGHCNDSNVCDRQGVNLRHQAITSGNVSTIGFVAGALLGAGAGVLWFTASPRSSRTGANVPRIGITPRWAGITLDVEVP